MNSIEFNGKRLQRFWLENWQRWNELHLSEKAPKSAAVALQKPRQIFAKRPKCAIETKGANCTAEGKFPSIPSLLSIIFVTLAGFLRVFCAFFYKSFVRNIANFSRVGFHQSISIRLMRNRHFAKIDFQKIINFNFCKFFTRALYGILSSTL